MSPSERPVVGWCVAKDCRGADRDGRLRDEVASRCRIVELRCLDLCDGAVVVGRLDETPVVFRKVRKRSVVRSIVHHLVDGEALSDAAEKRRVTGAKRSRAVRRLERKR